LHKLIVSHLHHCYLDLGGAARLPENGSSIQTWGIHPVLAANANKQPIADQITDTVLRSGECKKVAGATPEAIRRLRRELSGGACNSCASHYHKPRDQPLFQQQQHLCL
jgi:hypothetical protein